MIFPRATLALLILVTFTDPSPDTVLPFRISAVPERELPLLIDRPVSYTHLRAHETDS